MGRCRFPLLDATVALMASIVVVLGTYLHDEREPRALGLVLGVLAAVALFGRRRFPLSTAAVAGLLALAVLAVDPVTGPHVMVAPAAALASLAIGGSTRRQIVGGSGSLAVAVGAGVVDRDWPGVLVGVQHLAWVVVPILGVEVLRARRSYRAIVLERAVQEERLRIARDLHDVIGHTLTTINVQASVAGHLLERRPEHARHALEVIEEASRDAIAEVRGIVGVLRDPAGGPPPRTPVPGLDDVPGLVAAAGDSGLRARLDVTGARPAGIPDAVSRAAYRIVQESLTNAARHGAGTDVLVGLAYERGELAIEVANGVGIVGMAERAEAVGGSLATVASDGAFLVSARLPYRSGDG